MVQSIARADSRTSIPKYLRPILPILPEVRKGNAIIGTWPQGFIPPQNSPTSLASKPARGRPSATPVGASQWNQLPCFLTTPPQPSEGMGTPSLPTPHTKPQRDGLDVRGGHPRGGAWGRSAGGTLLPNPPPHQSTSSPAHRSFDGLLSCGNRPSKG